MLTQLVRISLKFRGVVIFLACALIAYGVWVTTHAKLDVFPDFVPPEIKVQTEAPHLPPEQVEQLVTRPVESAINGLGNLETIRSESVQGLSVVTAVFKDGTDIFLARQALGEKLAETAGELPQGVGPPKLEPLTSSTMDLLKFGITSDKASAFDLRRFAEYTLRPRLLAVPGVAKCSVYGGEVRELQIQINPAAMEHYKVSLQSVLTATKATIGVRGAGFIDTKTQRINVQADSTALTEKTLAELPVATAGGKSIRLGDVARVTDDKAIKVGEAVINGKAGVLLTMSSQYGANTMEVTKALEEVLGAMTEKNEEFDAVCFKGEPEGIVYHPGIHRPATFITSSLKNVSHSLILGGILVAAVLFLFLFNIRTAIISLTAIPLSLLAAVIVMDKFGFSLNTITLGGLAIAIGEVVDDAIIDVENIYRRLREDHGAAEKRSLLSVVLDASIEVRSAVVYATFVVTLVFVPVLMMTGLQGKFFAPLGWAYVIAILASLAVAVTVTPAMALVFFRNGVSKSHDPIFQRMLKKIYAAILSPLLKHAWAMVAAVAVMVILVAASIPFFGGEFLPDFKEGHFVMGVRAGPGTPMSEMRRIGELISKKALAIPHVHSIAQQIGRAELGEDTWGPEICEFHINLDDNVSAADQAAAEAALKRMVAPEKEGELPEFPGISGEVTTFLGDRIAESMSGEKAPVVIDLFGNNLDDLDEAAKNVREALEKIPNHGEVPPPAAPAKGPNVTITALSEKLFEYNFNRLDVLDAAQVANAGEKVGQQFEGTEVYDVTVILDPEFRRVPEQIGDLMISNDKGMRRPLSDLAIVYQGVGRNMILHENAMRRQVVTCTPEDVDPVTFVERAKAALAKVELPETVQRPQFTGAAEAQVAASNQLLVHSAIAGGGILLLLAIVFGNVRNLLLLLANLPFALVGGIVAVIITGHAFHFGGFGEFFDSPTKGLHLGTLSIGQLVGFVTLFGITTRNSIMLISHYHHLVMVEKLPWNRETALRGASERLVPILMTALVTALGLLPLALGSGEAGREIEGPMAIVILGGLASSTILNLLVMPTLALRFAKFKERVAS